MGNSRAITAIRLIRRNASLSRWSVCKWTHCVAYTARKRKDMQPGESHHLRGRDYSTVHQSLLPRHVGTFTVVGLIPGYRTCVGTEQRPVDHAFAISDGVSEVGVLFSLCSELPAKECST